MTKLDAQAKKEFYDLGNMSATELSDWLDTDTSKESGRDGGDGETKGHKSGRHIVDILSKNTSALSAEDVQHMHKVAGYIKRHKAQPPEGDIKDTTWRHSLMNWGHDPLKEQSKAA
jgi:hypothetical protein